MDSISGTGTVQNRIQQTDLLSRVGNTPLVKIRRLGHEIDSVEIYAKLECFNPGGSVKDRAGLRIIEDAERSGELRPGRTILDSTSGNTGIAYAWIGAYKGYPVELVMPANVSSERKKTVRAFGVKIIFSDPLQGSDGAVLLARKIYQENSHKYFLAAQYDNDSNWKAHFDTTGPEIHAQTEGRITHFLAGVGTGGTVVGTGRRLKKLNPSIAVFGVEPDDGLHGLEGLKHIPTSIRPGIYDDTVLDGTLRVETEEAYEMAHRLALEEGLLVGKSSGAAMVAALRLAREIRAGVIVTVFPDGGDRYLSTILWEGADDSLEGRYRG